MSDILYAIDPGTEQSALVMAGEPATGWIYPNEQLLQVLTDDMTAPGHIVIEEIASYGMPVGREVFQTVFWAGRFAQAWSERNFWCSGKYTWSLLPRKDVKLALCGSMKAKDANIRQALIDRYGGSACVKKGGALAGIKSHLWAALALAVAYQEQQAATR